MKSTFPSLKYVTLITTLLFSFQIETHADPSSTDWPQIQKESRPWTYWWWLGSAVTKEELTRHLTEYKSLGMGGVHIVPIYGAEGYEEQYIDYLTPKWMEMLGHTIEEGTRLDIGVDMTAGTGWPYGGPWVGPDDAAAKVLFEEYSLTGRTSLDKPIQSTEQPAAHLHAVVAFSDTGEMIDLTHRVDEKRQLDWSAPEGKWSVYAVFQGCTKQQVKRAAPGAEGNVIDYFSDESLHNYLSRFNKAFAAYAGPSPRAFYNDSYEVYGANWTDDFFTEFQNRRGYDLREELPSLLGKTDPERIGRIRSDYRETIHDLLLEEFTIPWVEWSQEKGSLTRDQAHGSPGNLIDLYGAADIPETEGFGPEGAEILVSKFASSASHLKQKRYTSSESCTWLGEHFQVPLSDVKPAIDSFFLAGINHVFYHGMPFSPKNVPFPGWLFYASTHFGLTNTFREDFRELNEYIARCQSFLQNGSPDNDVLLYFPIYDLWCKDHGTRNMLHYLQVHNSKAWFHENLQPTYKVAETMWQKGYAFDYISDDILTSETTAGQNEIQVQESSYKTLVIAGCNLIPINTLESVLRLASNGATVVIVGELPSDVPGLNDLKDRRKQLQELLDQIECEPTEKYGIHKAELGRGVILKGKGIENLLNETSVQRERLVDLNLHFIRRKHSAGKDYFLVNSGDEKFDGWVPILHSGETVLLFDPRTDTKGKATIRDGLHGERDVWIQLYPKESCVIRSLDTRVEHVSWKYILPSRPVYPVETSWHIEFIEGGPELPQPIDTQTLASWTEIGGEKARNFSGTAKYTTRFKKPDQKAEEWILDLSEIGNSARVYLNGKFAGTVWCRPFRIAVGDAMRDGENILEIEVTNLMANRIAAMDRADVEWKDFFFVNIDYKPFDASSWEPLPSGLLEPLKLIPCAVSKVSSN